MSLAKKIIIVLVFGAILLVNVRTIELGDFWWHISTGQWIFQNHTVPDTDPFSFTVDVPDTSKAPILKSYWLAQLGIFLIYKVAGFQGLIIARALFFALVFGLLFLILRRYGLGPLTAASLVLLAVPGLGSYVEVRPQVVSFFFALLVFYLIERLRQRREDATRIGLLLPLVMLIWSNMHGGYVIGVGIIGIFLLFQFVRDLKGGSLKTAIPLYVVSVVSIGACALNPASLTFLKNPDLVWMFLKVGRPELQSAVTIHEYFGPLKFYDFTGDKRYFFTLCLLLPLMAVSFVLSFRRLNYFHLALGAIFTVAALNAFRFGAFFFLFSIVFTGYNYATLRSGKELKGTLATALMAVPLLLALTLVLMERPFIKTGMEEQYLPVEAAAFIKENRPPAQLLGTYEWGGYLMWKLYPEYRTFIDGRVLSEKVYQEYNTIISNGYAAQGLLDKYGINTVLTYTFKPYDNITLPITFSLLKSSDWEATYWDTKSLIFVRRDLAGEKTVSKARIWNLLISMAQGWVQANPSNPEAHALLGEIYYEKRLFSFARESFQKALALDPQNEKARRYLGIVGAPSN